MKVKIIALFLGLFLLCYPLIVEADLDFKGVAYMSRGKESEVDDPVAFLRNSSDESLSNIRWTGANYVALVVNQYMSSRTSNSIYSKPNRTATDTAIAYAIDKIHSLGMNVMLKPHFDCDDGTWRGDIAPSDPTAWFNSYNTFIMHYAQIAQAHYEDGDIFCVATELKSMSQYYDSDWTPIIANIRASFTGPLTYAANWDEYPNVSFWDELDYAGLDAYFSLTDSQDASLQEIIDGWSYYNGEAQYVYDKPRHWIDEIETWQATINKPVIFTEIGYRSRDYAAMEPWNWEDGADYNGELQARCYEAAIQVFKDKSWFKGLFFWCWFTKPDAGDFGETRYSPQNKPAENTLTIWYEGGKNYAYGFEDGTLQGWMNDTTTNFVDNLGAPFNSTDEVHTMFHSLGFPLNLDNKDDAGTPSDPSDDYINDIGYTQTSSLNLTGYNGIRLYVYIPDTANIPDIKPACASVYVKTGSDYVWFESNYVFNITLGDWTEVNLNLSLAKDEDGNLGQQVTNVNNIHELGVHLSGAGEGSGSTLFYVDSIEYEGTSSAAIITVTVQGVTVGVTITDTYDFGTVQMAEQKVSDNPLVVTNTGTTTQTYSFYLFNPSVWTAVDTNPGNETYVLGAIFNNVQPVVANFDVPDDCVIVTLKKCTDLVFAGSQSGENVLEDETRDLWLLFGTPLITTSTTEQRIRLVISAEAS